MVSTSFKTSKKNLLDRNHFPKDRGLKHFTTNLWKPCLRCLFDDALKPFRLGDSKTSMTSFAQSQSWKLIKATLEGFDVLNKRTGLDVDECCFFGGKHQ